MKQVENNVVPLIKSKKHKKVDSEAITDSELLLLTSQGDRKAFDTYYGRHEKKIYNKALSNGWGKDIAERVTQDVFIKFYIKIIKSEKQIDYTIGYLFQMLRTVYIDYLAELNVVKEGKVGGKKVKLETLSTDDDENTNFIVQDPDSHKKQENLSEVDYLIEIINSPLTKANELVRDAKTAAEIKYATNIKMKAEEEVNIAMETFEFLYVYEYKIEEMKEKLGLTREQVKYRKNKLVDLIKSNYKK